MTVAISSHAYHHSLCYDPQIMHACTLQVVHDDMLNIALRSIRAKLQQSPDCIPVIALLEVIDVRWRASLLNLPRMLVLIEPS